MRWLPDYYSYDEWNKIDITLIDDSIAIVDVALEYEDDGNIYDSGSVQ